MYYYRHDLALVHDRGHGQHADRCAAGILALLAPVKVAYELGGLRGVRVFSEPIDDTLHSLLDGFVEPQERLPRLVSEFDLIGHRVRIRASGQASFGLDLFPRYKWLACLDARACLACRGDVSEVLKQLGQVVRRQPLKQGSDRGRHDGGYEIGSLLPSR